VNQNVNSPWKVSMTPAALNDRRSADCEFNFKCDKPHLCISMNGAKSLLNLCHEQNNTYAVVNRRPDEAST
jgi:hypothetical protein